MPRNITVTFADGSQHVYQNAPDNVTPEQVAARAQQDFGKQVKAMDGGHQPPKRTVADRYQPTAYKENAVGAAVRSFANAAIPGGIADRLSAAADAVLPTQEGRHSAYSEGFSQAYRRNLANERATDAANSQAHGGIDTVSGIAGALASPINKVAKLAPAGNALARMIAPAAVYGAIEGAGNTAGNAMKRLQAGAEGALSAAAGAFAGDKLARGVGRVLAPKFSGAVKALMDKGVNLTPGQIAGGVFKTAEDKLMSIPGLGGLIKEARHRSLEDWNRAMYNKVLEPIGQKASWREVGNAGIEKLETGLSAAYDRLLPRLTFKADSAFVGEVRQVLSHARELPPDMATQLNNIIENRIAPRLGQNGTMDGRTFKQMESELGNIVRSYRGSADAAQREMAHRVDDILEAMKGGLERSNKQFAPALKKLNASYAAFKRLQQAAGNRATSGGLFTPSDLLSAAKRMDRTAGKGAFAKGRALMQREGQQAQKVLPSTVPNSGTFDRYAGAAALLEAPKIVGMAAAHPLAAAGAGAAAGAYTRPGMALINRAARSTPGKTRNALAKLMQRSARPLAGAGAYAGAQLVSGGQ